MPLGRGQPCGVGRVPEGTPADVELLGEGQSRCWRPWAASLCRTSPAVGGHRGSISCRSRNFSSQTSFQIGECADLAYKMLNALQNPMHVAFRKALFVDMEVPQGFGLVSLRDSKLHVFEHTCLSDFDLPLLVLPECTFRLHGLVVSNAHWVVFETVVHDIIPPTVWADNTKEDAANNEADQSSSMSLWAQFPWLLASWENVGRDPAPQPSKSEPPKSGGLSAMPTDKDSAFVEFTIEEVMSQLEVCRAQLAGSASKLPDFFLRSVRGGNWTAANRGVVADIGAKRSIGYRFQAISATNICCRRGQESAEILVLAWAHRLQYRFDLCLDRGAIGSEVFFPVKFGRVHGARLGYPLLASTTKHSLVWTRYGGPDQN